jgi:DNA-binding response OmpR family regulator
VILTADATEAGRTPLIQRAATAFMTKPIAVQPLLELIDRLVGRSAVAPADADVQRIVG